LQKENSNENKRELHIRLSAVLSSCSSLYAYDFESATEMLKITMFSFGFAEVKMGIMSRL
jgi:hypothetical protein